MRGDRRPGRGRRTGALCVLSRRFRTPCRYGLAKVFWSVRCPTQVAPEYKGGATTSVPTRDRPAPPRRRPVRPSGPRQPRGRARAASVTVPVSSSNSPCASLVTAAGTGGARSATARRPDRTSSGRTAGVMCRTTSRSIAQGWSVGLSAGEPCVSRLTTAGRASKVRTPFLVMCCTSTASASVKASTARSASAGSTPTSRSSQTGGRQPVGETRGPRLDRLDDVEPGGQRLVEEDTQGPRGRAVR